MTVKRKIIVSLVIISGIGLNAQPIGLNPSNRHYFSFRGKPEILITSAEHYGAVVNGAFDYERYLEALKSYRLNYTRIYPGALFEPVDKFIKGNTLGVNPENLVLPWARSKTPGYCLGGNLFDLDNWNKVYFERLRDFIRKASDRGIVVEICFFNCQYKDTWPISPLYFKNNIQREGNCTFNDTQTLLFPDVAKRQSEYVRKIVQEVNSFDNVILEICDEPILFDTPDSLAGLWIRHMIDVIKETEKSLPSKHLIAQQLEGKWNGPVDFSNDPDVEVIVTQYVWAAGDQMGGMKGLDNEYGHNKVIELNETDYYPVWYGENNDKIASSRVEAWEFIVGGGAGFNQLNGLYTVDNPSGQTDDNKLICTSLSALKDFMTSFSFINMRPDKTFVVHGLPEGTFYRSISEPGKQYALYIHHSTRKDESYYIINPGKYRESIVVSLPDGDYLAEWINPSDGTVMTAEKIRPSDGRCVLRTPFYTIDIALRVKMLFLPSQCSRLSGAGIFGDNLAGSWILIMLTAVFVCFIVSEISRNYSQVDKLWSIMPVIYSFVSLAASPSPRLWIMSSLVTIWGLRLSFNFYRKGGYSIIPWQGAEDYRWKIMRQKPLLKGRIRFGLFNLFFISFYQHLLIFLFSSPLLLAAKFPATGLTFLDIAGALLIILFIIAESIADNQQFTFQRLKLKAEKTDDLYTLSLKKGFLSEGLWRYARHPNFACEQAVWITFYLFGVSASGSWLNPTLAGPVLLVLLFQGSTHFTESISSGKYPDYASYRKNVPKFIPGLFGIIK